MKRRELLIAAAGTAARAQTSTIEKIDIQSHLFYPELLARMEKRKTSPYAYRKGEDLHVAIGNWHRRVPSRHTDVAAKLADMDEAGIALTALSTNDPGPELFGTDGRSVERMVDLGYSHWVSLAVFDFTAGGEKIARDSARYLGQAEREWAS